MVAYPSVRARVFISCGQQRDTQEEEIASAIATSLAQEGFEPYVAVKEVSLKGVKENIFRHLSETEYLLFIDFKRERLFWPKAEGFVDTGAYRGSLFSHQELAIASFLETEAIVFREKGVKQDDGISKFIQANDVTFENRDMLPSLALKAVKDKISTGEWDPRWRRELLLGSSDKAPDDAGDHSNNNMLARWFHIQVHNLHRTRTAHNCVGYVERVRGVQGTAFDPLELVEFKWKGVTPAAVAIPPQTSRYLDAFHIYHPSPSKAFLGINLFIVDFTEYGLRYSLDGPGSYLLDFVVFSTEFAVARKTFKLEIGRSLADVKFGPA